MRKKKNTKSALLYSFISLVCLCASAFCVYLFYKDVSATLSKQNESPIAYIFNKQKTVQRKFYERVLWDRLQKESPVYNRDTVRTAAASYAFIEFPASGAMLELTNNSLVTVFLEGEDPGVDWAGGRVNIDTSRSDKGFIVQRAGRKMTVAADSVVQMAAYSTGVDDLRVIKGEAVIATPSGNISVSEGRGYEISYTDSGMTAVESPMVVVRNPLPSARIVSQEPLERVDFNLTAIKKPDGEKVILDIASDSGFNNITRTDTVNADSITEELAADVYYWRAYLGSAEIPQTAAFGRMEIVHVPQPDCVAPKQDQVFTYKTQKPLVNFSWTGTDAVDSYTIVIADNSRLDSPEVNARVNQASYAIDTLEDGRWYWQITPLLNGTYSGQVVSSKISSFSIVKSDELSQPALISPAENTMIDLNKANSELFFSWKNVREASKYKIEILRDGKLIESVETEHNLYRFAPSENETIAKGSYEWRITAVGSDGTMSVSSRSFSATEVDPVHRALFPPPRYAIEETRLPALTFSWETNIAEKARFQISRDSSFDSLVVDSLTAEHSVTGLRLEAGAYFWRVAAGNTITGEREFSVLPPMDSPAALSPANGAAVTSAGNYSFRWTLPEGASRFNMNIYRLNSRGEKTGSSVFSRESLSASNVTVNMANFDSGAYLWTIEPFAPETGLGPARAGKTAEFRFTYAKPAVAAVSPPPAQPAPPVSQPAPAPALPAAAEPEPSLPHPPLPQPVVTAPLRNQVFPPEYFSARREIHFSWQPVEGAETYKLTILKDGAVIYEAANLTDCAFSLTDLAVLDRGIFSYQLEAAEGARTSAASGTFQVSIPPLDVPHMTSGGVLFAY